MEKFYIGDLESSKSVGVHYVDDTEDGKFYHVLKERVEKYMKDNKVTTEPGAVHAIYVAGARPQVDLMLISSLVLVKAGSKVGSGNVHQKCDHPRCSGARLSWYFLLLPKHHGKFTSSLIQSSCTPCSTNYVGLMVVCLLLCRHVCCVQW